MRNNRGRTRPPFRVVWVSIIAALSLLLSGCGAATPDVRGMTPTQAEQVLEAADMVVGKVIYDSAAVGAEGAVVSQKPSAGERSKPGSVVVITVAGKEPVVVPGLVGLDEATARSVAQSAGFKLSVRTESAPNVSAGIVASQEPSAGVSVTPGSTLTVAVAQDDKKPSNEAAAPKARPTNKVHTPAKGSAERTAILDACRESLGYDGQFKVLELKVKGKRAIAAVEPASGGAEGAKLYLEQIKGRWAVIYNEMQAMDDNKVYAEISDWL